MLLLGTSAAEGWPSPFCKCNACAGARRHGGRDIRTRSGAVLDGVVKVDYGPDTVMQMQRANRDLRTLTTLVYTHEHDDHFTPSELQYRKKGFVPGEDLPTLHVYGNENRDGKLHERYEDPAALQLEFHRPLEPFRSVASPDGAEIFPVPATHSEGALLLKITRGDKKVLYGHDTGPFPEASLQALSNAPLDLALFDCTYGGSPRTGPRHLGIDGVLAMAERLRAVGAVTPRTLFGRHPFLA